VRLPGPFCLLFFAVVTLCLASPARAQSAGTLPGRIEVAVGLGLVGGAALGGDDANLRAADGSDFRLFGAESRFGGAPALEARAGLALTRRYAMEVRFALSHPELMTSISADVEGAPDIELTERIDQYVVDAAILVRLDRVRIGPVVPFASAGAGYLRQLHEGLTLVEEGTVYHVGGGVKHRFVSRARGLLKAVGLRGDVRVYLLAGGIAVRNRPRPHLAAAGSLFVAF
jgi:hypothetical protein